MWQSDRSRVDFKRILVIGEITAMSVLVASLAAFIWKSAGVGDLDPFVQVMFVSAFFLGIVFATNFILDRRW